MKKLRIILSFLISALAVTSVKSQIIRANPFYLAPKVTASSLASGIMLDGEMDESSGTITDYSGNGNTGTTHSVTYSATGKLGTALSYNGTSSYVDFGNNASLQLTTAGSVSVWVYPTVTYSQEIAIVGKDNYGSDVNGYFLYLDVTTGYVACELANASSNQIMVSTTALTGSAWSHVVLTWDGSNVNIYVNGTNVKSHSETVTPVSNVYNFHVGSVGNTVDHLFNGRIDQVLVYNRAITSTEVTTLYNGGAGMYIPY